MCRLSPSFTHITSGHHGRNQFFISGGNFTKFHSMTSSCLFNRGTTFRKRSHIIINVFLPTDTKSIIQRHTFCTTLLTKTRQNRTFYNSVGGRITGVKRNFSLHAICVFTEQHSTYQIRWENWWLGHRIWCLGKCVGLGLCYDNWSLRLIPIFFTGFTYSRTVACFGYLTSNRKV